MSNIPLEVQMHAERLYDEGGYESVPTIIAKAIMAETERCIGIVDNFIEHVVVEIDGRSRFSIQDINKECRKSARYIRDQISGEFEKNWGVVTPSQAKEGAK